MAARPSVSPGGSGSSTNSGRPGATASIYCSATAAEAQRPWKSTMISTSSPTAARIAAMQRATLSIWRGLGGVVGVGDEHGLERPVAALDDLARPLDQGRLVQALIDRGHLAQAQMRVDRDAVAGPAAEQAPDRHAQRLGEDVPAGGLDAGDGAVADHAEPPEAVLGEHPHQLLDVARIAAQHQRRRGPRRHRRRRASSTRASPRPSRPGPADRCGPGRTPSSASPR